MDIIVCCGLLKKSMGIGLALAHEDTEVWRGYTPSAFRWSPLQAILSCMFTYNTYNCAYKGTM